MKWNNDDDAFWLNLQAMRDKVRLFPPTIERVQAHPLVPKTALFEETYPDWRRRLARNLSAPARSTRPAEPLTRMVSRPAAFLINGTLYHAPSITPFPLTRD